MNNTKKNYRIFPWLMLVIAILFYFYQFLLQVSPSVMVPQLKHAFNIKNTSLGILASIFFYAYAGMQIPIGILLDRFGTRRLLTLAALCCATGALLFAGTHIFTIAIFGRFLIGCGAAAAYIGCAYIAANWLPTNRFAMINGAAIGIGMLGAIGGQAPLALIVAKLHWEPTLILFGTIGIIISFLFWTFIRDKITTKTTLISKKSYNLLTNIKYITRSKQNWLCAIYGGLMFAPILLVGTLWGVPFITTKYATTTPIAASIVSTLFIGFAFGAPILGWLSDHFRRRNIFLISSSIIALLTISFVIYMPAQSKSIAAILLLIFGFSSSGLEIMFTIAREINPTEMVGTVIGFMNAINTIGAAILMPIIGIILELHGVNTGYINSARHYEIALTILPAIQIIAIILALRIKETYAKPKTNLF